MPSLLEQLENNEAVLLMYLADELPAEDRAEVEQLLASDAGLRAALRELSGMQDQVMSGLAALDAASAPSGSQAAAVRQVSRDITRWNLEGHPEPVVQPTPRALVPWWSYPLTAAAAILVAFLVWSQQRPFTLGPKIPDNASDNRYVERNTLPSIPLVTPTNAAPPAADPEQDRLAETLFPEPREMKELNTVATVERETRDTGDLFGNDW
jgi:anti-sigma factor RsiW